MYELAFRLKRAHLRNLTLCRRITRPFRLTPARFDILYAISAAPKRCTRQCALLRILGLAASTISEMLTRLEQLRLIERRPDPSDKRHRLISLTEQGYLRVSHATEEIFFYDTYEEVLVAYTDALARHVPVERDGRLYIPSPGEVFYAAFRSVGQFFELTQRFARGLGDCASLVFPDGDH